MTHLHDRITQLWDYAESRNLLGLLDGAPRSKERPPVFRIETMDANVIRDPDEPTDERVLDVTPRSKRHKWFASMRSSQVLAQSVFGNLIVHGKLNVLRDVATDTGEPLFGVDLEGSAELEHAVSHLGEPRPTELDVLVRGKDGYRIALECKFLEEDVGACSRPNLTPKKNEYELQHCDGSYTVQRERTTRCSLTEIGVQYWTHIPQLLSWPADRDHEICPLRAPYQLVRNVLAVSASDEQNVSLTAGHAVLIYDARHPAFRANPGEQPSEGKKAFDSVRKALKEPFRLRRCSWQTIMSRLSETQTLPWLVEEVRAKYGL